MPNKEITKYVIFQLLIFAALMGFFTMLDIIAEKSEIFAYKCMINKENIKSENSTNLTKDDIRCLEFFEEMEK